MKNFTIKILRQTLLSSIISFITIPIAIESIIPEEYAKKFYEYNIVNKTIPVLPRDICQVEYPNGLVINPGTWVKNVTEVKDHPKVSWNCDMSYNYTLIFHNLNGSDRMTDAHSWVLTNIAKCDLNQSDVMFPYEEPMPDKGVNVFLFLIYKQLANVRFKLLFETIFTKYIFTPHEYAMNNYMGNPIAGNFFLIDYPIKISYGAWYIPTYQKPPQRWPDSAY